MSHIPDCESCKKPIYGDYKIVFDAPMHPNCAEEFEEDFHNLKEQEEKALQH